MNKKNRLENLYRNKKIPFWGSIASIIALGITIYTCSFSGRQIENGAGLAANKDTIPQTTKEDSVVRKLPKNKSKSLAVEGIVTDPEGNLLAGVAILGPSIAYTDKNGRYKLVLNDSNYDAGEIIEFHYKKNGYEIIKYKFMIPKNNANVELRLKD